MTHPSLRWGLMGASDIAEKRMLGALRRTGNSVAAVLSSSPTRSVEFARRNGIPRACTVVEEFLTNDIDAVYVSSSNDMHLSHVRSAAAAGKHVLCEKPVALNLVEATAIIEACVAAGVTLAVNHHLPAAGTHHTIRELVSCGAIGRPLAVSIAHTTLLPDRLRGWRLSDAPGAGVILDLSCHDASVVNLLLGCTPIDVAALTATQGSWQARSEDVSMAVVRYGGGVLAQFHDSFTTAYTPPQLVVHGEEGTIQAVGVMAPEPIGTVTLSDSVGTRTVDVEDRRHSYDNTLRAFTAAVHESGRPVVTGEDGYNALAVALAVRESATSGQRVVLAHKTSRGQTGESTRERR
jgi:1,5-anhydro-D-fructose reductase (1,5-anhydro-D-mannitol-forming)